MKRYLSVAALLMGLMACTPESPEVKAELSVEETKIEASEKQETFSLTIKSNTTWNIKCEDDWVFCDPDHGDGDAVVEIAVFANDDYEVRSTTLEIKGNGIAEAIRVPITQAFAKGLLVDTTPFEVGAEGGVITVDLQSNVDVKAEIEVDWISLVEPTRALNSSQMVFKVEANQTTEPRKASILLSGEGVKNKVLIVNQAARGEETLAFANAAFKTFLLNNSYDVNGDNEFFASELDAVTSIRLWCHVEKINKDSEAYVTFETDLINDLSDLKYLTNLEELDIQGVPSTLTSIDLSANTNLRMLNCANTAITEIDLSSNTEMVD